jgi:DnaJ like chaperone protein
MSWWGKILGGTVGFMLGGPLGALLGASLGHQLDGSAGYESLSGPANRERIQSAFFTATFSVMGHICKADGKVTADEIQLAQTVMDQMQLTGEQRTTAKRLFDEGKSATFPFKEVMEQFRRECRRRNTLMQMFLEIQLHAAYADGTIHPAERNVLQHACDVLGFSAQEFAHLEAMVRSHHQFEGPQQTGVPSKNRIQEAYAVLDIAEKSSPTEIKKAYRRLMSQHHPDKLVAKGLPEEMMKIAGQKTHEIKMAYETIRKARGF